jgi:hypothetical protein
VWGPPSIGLVSGLAKVLGLGVGGASNGGVRVRGSSSNGLGVGSTNTLNFPGKHPQINNSSMVMGQPHVPQNFNLVPEGGSQVVPDLAIGD